MSYQHHVSAKIYTFLFNGRNPSDSRKTSMQYFELDLNKKIIINETPKKIEKIFGSEIIDLEVEKKLKDCKLEGIEAKIANKFMRTKSSEINKIPLLSHLKKENRKEDFIDLLTFYLWQESINLEDFYGIKKFLENKKLNETLLLEVFHKFSYGNKFMFDDLKNHAIEYNLIENFKHNLINENIKIEEEAFGFIYNIFWCLKFFHNLNRLSFSTDKKISLTNNLDDYHIINIELNENILYPQGLCFNGLKMLNNIGRFDIIKNYKILRILNCSYFLIEGPYHYSVIINKKLYYDIFKKNIKENEMQKFTNFLRKNSLDFLNQPHFNDLIFCSDKKDKIISSLLKMGYRK